LVITLTVMSTFQKNLKNSWVNTLTGHM